MPEEPQNLLDYIREVIAWAEARRREDNEESRRHFDATMCEVRRERREANARFEKILAEESRTAAILQRLEANAEAQRAEHKAMIGALMRMLDRLPPPEAA